MIFLRDFLRTALALFFILASVPADASREASTRLALEARELLDSYFGNQANLTQAAEKLERALVEDETDAAVWLQAARLTILGGHIVSRQFRPGTVDAYGELLDRALALDDKNANAHLLKSGFFNLRGDHVSELAELKKAEAFDNTDPWLVIGYARHARSLGNGGLALFYYDQLRKRGPGPTLVTRDAYIAALAAIGGYAATNNAPGTLKEVAASIRKERDPRDAWALSNLAKNFFGMGLFDDSIALCREALSIMNYGDARLRLASSLYGKAAELESKGDGATAEKYVKEAKSLGFDRSLLLRQFEEWDDNFNRLMPILKRIMN